MQILRKTSLKALQKAAEIGPEETLRILEEKGLVGRGGAAYPTAKKWRISKEIPSEEKYVICNADEGEPGTFKDRHILENNAETMIEGMLIAAQTIGAKQCYIYLRGEYEYLRPALQKKVEEVMRAANTDIKTEIVRGAGAYICGEETAIIQSIMGFRGSSTYKPPHPTVSGLWGKPTAVNNVETLACAAQALLFDDWDASLRLFSISGNVTKPGLYELPLGIKMSTIIEMVQPQHKLKAMSFGCFGGVMPVDYDLEITDEAIFKENCHHGAYSVILIDEKQKILDVCLSIARFYTYESCGKCTPCREGTIRMLNILKRIRDGKGEEEDMKVLDEFARHVQETSLCGLGQTSGQHIITALQHFRNEFEVTFNENKH
jgi:NADH-quinone oxidoreductase subunit F